MKTYAQVAESLSRKKGKYEKNISSFDPAKRFSAERMSNRIDTRLDELFNAQEISKTKEGRKYLKNGGTLKYQDGGRPKFLEGWEDSLSFNARNFDNWGLDQGFSNRLKQPPLVDDSYRFIPKPYDEMGLRGRGPFDHPQYEFSPKPFDKWGLRDKVKPSGTRPELYESSVPSPTTIPRPTSGGTRGGSGRGSVPATTTRVNDTGIAANPNRPELGSPSLSKMKEITDRLGISKVMPGSSPGTGSGGGKNSSTQDWMGKIAPFMDNFANLINPTPNVPVPGFMRAPVIDTKVNVSPAIDEMRRGVRGFNRQIDNTVSQGNTAAAYKGKGLADFLNRSSGLMMDKDNQERSLRNQQAQSIASVDNMNTQITNQYQNQLMGREEAERMRRIGLIGNLGEDFMTISNDKKLHNLDTDRYSLLMEVFKDVIQSSPGLKTRPEFNRKYGGKLKRRVKR